MKRFLCLLTALLMLMLFPVSAAGENSLIPAVQPVGTVFPETSLPEKNEFDEWNPFNNPIFNVVAEFKMPENFYATIFGFETVSYNSEWDDTLQKTVYKPTYLKINYDGTTVVESLCDPTTDYELAQKVFTEKDALIDKGFVYSYDQPGAYNDGVALGKNAEGYTGLFDVDGNELVADYDFSGYMFDYNLGVLTEISAAMGFGSMEYDTYFTSLTNVMTDNVSIRFNAYITTFNDDGYAILQTGDENDSHHYVIKLKSGVIPTVLYNGKKIRFDQIPVIENGRTLVPLRAIFETLGAEVVWDGATQTVTAVKGDSTITLTINNQTATKNGEAITLDVPAKIINGRTMVPVRFIADCFGVNVEWDGVMKQVLLNK